jgi:TolB-like protein/Flp pilus assembly protein TadD
VLPFTNAGGDPNEEYFSDGLTEELIAALARLRSLQVAARTSVFAFKGENRDVREIGKQLGVAVLVEGNVRKEGDRVRVHAQLINTADGFHIWNESYDRNVADIFELQTELALSIAKALKTKLTPLDRQHLAKPPTTNLEAHTAYLKGRYYGYQRTGGALRKAIQHYESAIAADPNYARAYAGLATTYAPMGIHGFLHPAEAKERLRALTLRALEIDPDLAQARIALAALRGPYEWDFSTAEKEFLRAIELDPEESLAHNWYGYMLEWLDRMDEALAQRKASMNLEPISANATGSVGASLLLSGRTAASIEQSLKSLELDSTYWLGHLNLGIGYQVSGDIANAIRSFEKARAYGGIAAKGRGALAGALALAGRTREARKIVDSLAAEATASNVHAPMVAPALLALGDKEAAIAWLEKSYRARHPDLPRGLIDPRLASLRNDPRFIDLRRRVGVKP